jgi:hypothetical protein
MVQALSLDCIKPKEMKVTLSLIFILFSTYSLIAEKTEKGSKTEFKISVIQTEDSLLLNCDHGCYWQNLKFTYQKGDKFIVDQSGGGTVSYHEDGSIMYEKDLLFSFMIEPGNKVIQMKGLDGTNWLETSITTSDFEPVFIDNFGVSNEISISKYLNHEPFANMSIFFGLVLIVIGIIFKVKAPKKINHLYGYRTKRSMKDQAHWDYAHEYSANLSIYLGLACMAVAPVGWYLQLSEVAEVFIGVGWLILVCFMLFWRTENALKEKFEE